jgi:hypothetical protein
MSERNAKELGSSDLGIDTVYDENLVKTQVNDWITKLVGLTYDVPPKEKKKMMEEIVKTIRSRMLKS